MVRAAASGAIDYTQADPDDVNWRMRHALLLREVRRQDNLRFVAASQQHWAAFVAHGRLTPESYTNVSKHANEALDDYQHLLFPWTKEPKPPEDATATAKTKPQPQKVTIDKATADLISAYKARFGDQAE